MVRSFILITIGSAAGFQSFNSALNLDVLPPPPGKYAGKERHRWRNATTSLVNSAIMACIVVYCLFSHPDLWKEPVLFYTVSADVCLAVISGYLIYDTYDLMVHSHFSKVQSVVAHHVIMNFVFFVLSVEQLAMGLSMIALLCEFSAIFLHSRQLLLMYGFSKHSSIFSVHKIFNLVTFVLLRLVPLMYGVFVSYTCERLPVYLAIVIPALMTVVAVINCVLLWRLLCSDFLTKSDKDSYIMDN